MKALAIAMSIIALFFCLINGAALGAAYQAGASTMALAVAACETRTISIDCADFGTSPIVGGGFYIDNSGTLVSVAEVSVYDGAERTPAIWDTGAMKVPDPFDPPEVGDYFLALSNLGAGVTPERGVRTADVKFCCTGEGNATITIRVPDPSLNYDMWVTQDMYVHDAAVTPFVIAVTCTTGTVVCGNGIREGNEQCDGGNCCTTACTYAPPGTSCTDGIFCNGEETCDAAGVCRNGTPVICEDDGLYCNGTEYCDENAGSCRGSGNPCPSDMPYCYEVTDECSAEGPPATIHLNPESWYRSRWVPLIRYLRIEGSDTHFDRQATEVTFTPENAVIMLSRVIDQSTIGCLGILMPVWWEPVDEIDVTVATGTETASATLDLTLLPLFLEQGRSRQTHP